jgi:bifunctional DNase/RNase
MVSRAQTMDKDLPGMEKFEVKKVAGPIEGGAAVFLVGRTKAFVVFVGLFEATAIVKELQKQTTIRPLTHDLLHNILLGFDIEVKRVMISKIVDNTFCATLVLEQKMMDESGQFTGKRHEVRIDARASDSIIIALKTGKEIWVTQEVYQKVEDVSGQLDFIPPTAEEKEEKWEGTGLKDVDLQIPDYPPDEDEDKP